MLKDQTKPTGVRVNIMNPNQTPRLHLSNSKQVKRTIPGVLTSFPVFHIVSRLERIGGKAAKTAHDLVSPTRCTARSVAFQLGRAKIKLEPEVHGEIRKVTHPPTFRKRLTAPKQLAFMASVCAVSLLGLPSLSQAQSTWNGSTSTACDNAA